MIKTNKDLQFSQLFKNHSPNSYYFKKGEILHEHPFYFLENFLDKDIIEYNLGKYEVGFAFYKHIKDAQMEGFNRFEYEYCLVPNNKTIYLNELVGKLLEMHTRLTLLRKNNLPENDYLGILLMVLKNILKDIFISYHLDLDNSNRDKLSKWFYLKESITSFYFTNYIDEKRLKDLYQEYLVRPRFISYSDSFETFKCLFEGRRMENKINWIDQKSSLFLLIRLLRKHKIIRNTKNKHWLITSEFFLLKGETLIPSDFLNQKETQNPEKRKNLIAFVNHLVE